MVRSTSRSGKGEFEMILGSSCPSFLRGRYSIFQLWLEKVVIRFSTYFGSDVDDGNYTTTPENLLFCLPALKSMHQLLLSRCPPCPAPVKDLVPAYLLKKEGGKREVVCTLVRLQEGNIEITDVVDKVNPTWGKRVKREPNNGGEIVELKYRKKEEAAEIELLDLCDKCAHETDLHNGEENGGHRESSSPNYKVAALTALFGGDFRVRKRTVEKKNRIPGGHNSKQNDDVIIEDILLEGKKTATVEANSCEEKMLFSNPMIGQQQFQSPWSPFVVISAVFLVAMAVIVIVVSLVIKRLNMTTRDIKVLKCFK